MENHVSDGGLQFKIAAVGGVGFGQESIWFLFHLDLGGSMGRVAETMSIGVSRSGFTLTVEWSGGVRGQVDFKPPLTCILFDVPVMQAA